MLFNPGTTKESINAFCKGCMIEYVGIEIIELGSDYIKAKMPVNERTRQPLGLLHGGASVVLSESLGSIAASCTIDPTKQYSVGLEINANHIKSARQGFVFGMVEPIHVGKKTQVWQTKITNEKDELISISRLTMAVIDKK